MWLLLDWYDTKKWWLVRDDNIDCTQEEMSRAAEGYFSIESARIVSNNEPTVSGMVSHVQSVFQYAIGWAKYVQERRGNIRSVEFSRVIYGETFVQRVREICLGPSYQTPRLYQASCANISRPENVKEKRALIVLRVRDHNSRLFPMFPF